MVETALYFFFKKKVTSFCKICNVDVIKRTIPVQTKSVNITLPV